MAIAHPTAGGRTTPAASATSATPCSTKCPGAPTQPGRRDGADHVPDDHPRDGGPDDLRPLRRRPRARLAQPLSSCPTAALLPALTVADDLLTIVPAAPVETLIAPPPATATPSDRRQSAGASRRIGCSLPAGERAPQPFERAVAEAVEPGLRPEQHQRPHRDDRDPQLDPAQRPVEAERRSRRTGSSSGCGCRDNW